jgi:hypothetical protein
MSATDSVTHGCKPCGVVPVRWRRCRAKTGPAFALDAAVIPAPSFRRRAAARGHPRPQGSDRPCACTVPPPGRGPGGPRPFCALRRRWRLGAAAPGARSVSFATAAPGCGSSHSSPRLRPRVLLGRFGFPSPAVARLCHRWPGPGALGSRGAGGCAPFWLSAPSFRFDPSGFFPRPSFAWLRLASPCGGLRRRFGFYRGDVAFHASLGSWSRPGGGGSLPLNLLVPRPFSFAIDRGGRLRYNDLGGGRNDPTGTLFHPVSCCRIPGRSG